jgi:hypothetical protein
VGKKSRDKGARGELEWAEFLRKNLQCPDARRGRQYQGGDDSPDVKGGIPGTSVEVKRVEALRIHAAIDQAVEDAGEDEVPYVAFKKNHKDWLVIVKAEDLVGLAKAIALHLWVDTGDNGTFAMHDDE